MLTAELPSPELDYASIDDHPSARHRTWFGNLPPLLSETKTDAWLYGTLALICIAAFFFAIHQYWTPASPGTDQNGYLVGGKNFSHTFSTGFVPQTTQEFVGREWIEARGKYFPKYPLGLSVVYAAMLKLGGD